MFSKVGRWGRSRGPYIGEGRYQGQRLKNGGGGLFGGGRGILLCTCVVGEIPGTTFRMGGMILGSMCWGV